MKKKSGRLCLPFFVAAKVPRNGGLPLVPRHTELGARVVVLLTANVIQKLSLPYARTTDDYAVALAAVAGTSASLRGFL